MPLSFTQGIADFPHLSGRSTQGYMLYNNPHPSTAHSLQTKETPRVWNPPTSYCFLSWKGEYISRTTFKERSRCSKQEHYHPNML
ncbi:hypothetical protein KP509_07G062900 [Ceratopteris richardii]|uniref:Uncharacterized protein n=1 Tax=Ceratopteris richardii TaxID=49495 RepID=A0A8T2UF72_CERRI|nr:hypothetical protein KP509_07G062900 [Ceratopteris richardii]